MAKSRSDTNKYRSRHTDDVVWVTAAQFITELVCEKKAQKQKKDLTQRFWTQPEWKRYFYQQVRAANALLKIYDPRAIIAALKDQRAFGLYSLLAPNLDAIIEEHQRTILARDKVLAEPVTVPIVDIEVKPRPAFSGKKSQIGKLSELDG